MAVAERRARSKSCDGQTVGVTLAYLCIAILRRWFESTMMNVGELAANIVVERVRRQDCVNGDWCDANSGGTVPVDDPNPQGRRCLV
ncbi:MAG: hypothetical protein CMM47_09610 [Rhodospirillaceae bacterium]|nr:hypothetical protein [Rhodospirillaceae bacterium]